MGSSATHTHGEWRARLIAEDLELTDGRGAGSMLAPDDPVISSIERPAPIPAATTSERVE